MSCCFALMQLWRQPQPQSGFPDSPTSFSPRNDLVTTNMALCRRTPGSKVQLGGRVASPCLLDMHHALVLKQQECARCPSSRPYDSRQQPNKCSCTQCSQSHPSLASKGFLVNVSALGCPTSRALLVSITGGGSMWNSSTCRSKEEQ